MKQSYTTKNITRLKELIIIIQNISILNQEKSQKEMQKINWKSQSKDENLQIVLLQYVSMVY